MNIKKKIYNILIVYVTAAVFCIIVGLVLDSDFLLVMAAIVAMMGGLFATQYMTKHIISILKQNNLWTDETFEKKKNTQTKLTDTEAKTKDGFD